MYLYRCRFDLASIMYYDVFDRGQPDQPVPYLHNDLLAYTCQWADHEDFFPSIAHRERHYVEYLSEVTDLGLYITPAFPIRFRTGKSFIDYDRTGRTFGTVPLHEVLVVDPGSVFEAYLFSEKPVAPFSKSSHNRPRVMPCLSFEWWRTLQQMPDFDVDGEELIVKRTTGVYRAACPLNMRDVPPGVIQQARYAEIARARLACEAECIGDYYEVGPGVGLPVGMRFRVDSRLLPPDLNSGYDLSES